MAPDYKAMQFVSLVYLLEIVGEAANTVSDDFTKQFPDIPWRKVIELRNRLIHGYFDINLDIVSDTILSRHAPPFGAWHHES
jgi:uncharacterized protein with HEPN domain